MFSSFYNLSIRLYQTALQLAAPFHLKARLAVAGRRNLPHQLSSQLADNQQPIAWFHAASLGEFEQGRPVIEAFRQQYPDYKILLTFFSPSGYEVRKNYAGADYIFYLPLDTAANARRFVDVVKPRIAFFIKYEFWYNYLRELHARNVPIIGFSVIFRPSQIFFKPWGGFYRDFLRYFDHLLVQNQESVDLLRRIGITHVTRAGDTRFDRVKQIVDHRKEMPEIAAFKGDTPLLVVGSAWQADMDVLIPFLNRFDKPLKIIIAPHEIHDDEIERWRTQLPGPSVRYSEIKERKSERVKERLVEERSFALSLFHSLIIDNVGMLSSLYAYGDFAYVGGAFGKGLHNILEAATYGIPIFFGPNYDKFQEAVDLVREGGAFSVQDSGDIEKIFRRLYDDSAARSLSGAVASAYVTSNTGATSEVMEVVKRVVSQR